MARPYKQEPPFAVQVELTLGCNLACSFCGILGIGYGRTNRAKMMTIDTAAAIAQNIASAGWTSRIEFARRGEPLLNPHAVEIMHVFRHYLPKQSMMMLTNGVPMAHNPSKVAADLFDAGLNVLAVEEYDQAPHGIGSKLDPAAPFQVYNYPAQSYGNPHRRRTPKVRDLVLIHDIKSSTQGTHATLNNHGGYAGPLVHYDKPCAKPFREMSINWNGTVNYCCIAWGGEGKCGNAATEDLNKLWNNSRFNAVRRYLLHGYRTILTCTGCDHPSYRTGLLPDKYGKHKDAFPQPTSHTRKVIRAMETEGHEVPPTKVYHKRRARFKEDD